MVWWRLWGGDVVAVKTRLIDIGLCWHCMLVLVDTIAHGNIAYCFLLS